MASDPALLTPLGEDIWIVDGPTIDFYKIPFPTRMTVMRLQNGDLFLHSPIAYTPQLAAELEALGRIRHLVSPNWIHYAYIGTWAEHYPEAVSWASPGVRERAESRNVSIAFDRDLGEAPAPDWAEEIDQLIVRGSKAHTEVVFFHKKSHTLVLTDLIENMHGARLPLWVRPFAWLAGILAPNGKMPLDIWMSFAGNRDKLGAALARMLDWDPTIVVLAHGDILRENAPQRLREGFRGLAPTRHSH
ncbi:DUF4336 domain-containing protein [Phaeobacter sp. HF9A]|uniref:DUF4336 domain-containing protein n=1 Tax=Phaeobacter sp. HF9A TaxID=2721561 RepID=UPI00143063AD|nr:DUF4336 domain-containing protein [Phaeobacter sp. HF9A]NIZ12539.1 DUF4336 domain-containing protein [Phaeobacter sp. HF9A]